MQNDNQQYYKQAEIWSDTPDLYQRQVLHDILNMIPSDVESILDLGCGDGKITNHLPVHIHVVGVDISEEALKYVKRDTVVSSITELPFPDNSFDLVMSNDVFEHLTEEEFAQGLLEMKRVAKKYILLTVPHSEQLAANETKCSNCGEVYHIHWHQRNFDKKKIVDLFSLIDWKAREIRYSGASTLPPHDPSIQVKQGLGIFHYWDGAVCPNCQSKEQHIPDQEATQILPYFDAIRHEKWFDGIETTCIQDRSELIALYQYPYLEEAPFKEVPSITEQEDSIHRVQFANHLQAVSPDFTVGSVWARFRLPETTKIVENGITNQSDKTTEVPIRMSVVSKAGDKLVIKASGSSNSDRVELYAIDGITGLPTLLFASSVEEQDQTFEVPINSSWNADKFGLPLSLYLYGKVIVNSLEYIAPKTGCVQPFLQLSRGLNILSSNDEPYQVSWSLWTDHEGLWPKPMWFKHDGVEYVPEKEISWIDLIKKTSEAKKLYNNRIDYLNELLNRNENNRSLAESALVLAQKQLDTIEAERQLESQQNLLVLEENKLIKQGMVQVSEQFESLQNEVKVLEGKHKILTEELEITADRCAQVELDYKEALPAATLWTKNLNRKVKRVLVLSHMFPHPDQKVSGPFIHEQVKALREYEGIDARVISCRPFWMNGINIKSLWRANQVYPQVLADTKWEEYDGVPVLYPPYRVGSPFIPFRFHAWSYSQAVLGVIENVWKDFKFDLIHAHTAYLDGTAASSVAEKYQVPLILTEHTGPFSNLTKNALIKQLTLRSIGRADQVYCVSESLMNEVKSYFSDKNVLDKIKTLYNGVSIDDFYVDPAFSVNTQALRFTYVGYLEEVKDPYTLVKAFAKVHQALPEATLKIVGDGTIGAQVRELIQTLGLEQCCFVLGLQSRQEVSRILREETDVFVLPSKAETFGVVLIEAMASGKPVVATRCGGPESIVTESFLGELCEKEDPLSLAEAMITVGCNIEKYASEDIRKHAVNRFSYNYLAYKLTDIYQNT
ncbi:glycosyltransferase [Brevibacillus sp. HB1.4B]|uniref:glycosyltransferase n=1 Tax=Brevibacillus sp. HB1.4B TaxID=2738845 RepID=UPI00156B1DF8|nr:glycosyltransferase [Brevibacillus sp. HB1.4B]NRS18464.1 glycosyltransferase [Brevibacillus sp. HB1.4B]